jgi:ketosteroid isomerase-like protein
MKRIIPLTVMLMAVALTMSSCTSEKVNIEAEKAEISKIIDAYCKTINDDDLELVNQIWSHGDEVSFIAPSGRYSSYNEIRDNFVHGVFGVNFTKRNLQKEELNITVYGDAAWAEFNWVFDATRNDGSSHNTKGRESQFFHKENGQWKLVHIHYSSRNR